MMKTKCDSERGQVLAEFAVSLPVLVMLLVTVGGIFLYAVQIYRQKTAETELISEISIAMERIAEDASTSSTFEIAGSGNDLTLYRGKINEDDREESVRYFVNNHAVYGALLCRNKNNEPITGANRSGEVVISSFNCSQDGSLLRIELTGKSVLVKREFTLCTAFFFPDME